MSRKKITEKQVKVYRQSRNGGKTYKIAAAQPRFAERSAYNMEKLWFYRG